jgi:signal peptidase II
VRPLRRWSIVLGSAAVVLVLDQCSKWWAVDRLRGAEPIDVVWTLRLNYAENTGMAFSAGAGRGWLIGLVASAIVVTLLVVSRRVTSTFQLVLIGVVVGGALGNVLDRLFRARDGFMSGAVVDFIDFQWWPIFNVADTAVVVGGILLAITMVLEPDGSPRPA